MSEQKIQELEEHIEELEEKNERLENKLDAADKALEDCIRSKTKLEDLLRKKDYAGRSMRLIASDDSARLWVKEG